MKKGQLAFPGDDDLKSQIEELAKHGISSTQMVAVVDEIINGDLGDPNFKKSNKALIDATDKPAEAARIIDNYGIALAKIAEDAACGKDDQTKAALKLSIIVGLHALGMETAEIHYILGIAETL
jgi:hypothetical protein